MVVICEHPAGKLKKNEMYTVESEFVSFFGHRSYILKEIRPGIFKKGFKASRFRLPDYDYADTLLKEITRTRNLIN